MKIKEPKKFSGSIERLAATYSRGSYTTTTIGKAAFDGRVRDGNGSVHSFMATKKLSKNTRKGTRENSLKTTHRRGTQSPIRELKSLFPCGKKAIKPHDRLVLVR
jgi:hypothetical protein